MIYQSYGWTIVNLLCDSQYADLPVTKTPDDIITEEEQKQIDEIQKKYDF